MSAEKMIVKSVVAWHDLRHKLLIKSPLSDRERKMLVHVLNQSEGVLFPTLREIESYKQNIIILENTCRKTHPATFDRAAESSAAFEETYLPDLRKIVRSVS